MNKEEYIKTNLKDVLRFCGAQSIYVELRTRVRQ